jgi:hypothetical protein
MLQIAVCSWREWYSIVSPKGIVRVEVDLGLRILPGLCHSASGSRFKSDSDPVSTKKDSPFSSHRHVDVIEALAEG